MERASHQPETDAERRPLNLLTVEKQAANLLELEDGWDGPGSRAIDAAGLTTLMTTLQQFEIAEVGTPQLVPRRTGNVQAEWHHREQTVEIGINDDGMFAFVVTDNDGYLIAIEKVDQLNTDQITSIDFCLRRNLSDESDDQPTTDQG